MFRRVITVKRAIAATVVGTPMLAYGISPAECKRNIRLYLSGLSRSLRSVYTAAVVATDYKISLHGLNADSDDYSQTRKRVHKRSADRVLKCCLKNGGLYIKMGQGLVTMNHILPKEYLDTLVVLQDQALSREMDEVNVIFREDLGALPGEIFATFNPTPIAAASLAQVHQATTVDGQKVAVKIQYRDLRFRFHGDMLTMSFLANCLGYLYPKLNFAWMLREIRTSLENELDFEKEAENSERCSSDLSHLQYVYVPKVNWKHTSKRILTTEYIDGFKISDTEKLKSLNISIPELDRKLVQCFADQIFLSGHVHADPHPGNIFVRLKEDNSPQLVLLDHGLYEYIDTKNRLALANLYKHTILKDEENMRKYSQQLGVDEWHLFACFITQKYVATPTYPPPDWRKIKSKQDWKKLSGEEKQEIRAYFVDMHDRMLEMIKIMPKELLLISRNLNTIRYINRSHGSQIDRYSIMARSALHASETHEPQISYSFTNQLSRFHKSVTFEYNLRLEVLKTWVIHLVLKFLKWANQIKDMEELANQHAPKDIDFAS